MVHFCTYFNQDYLSRRLALHYSLAQHMKDFTLWVLCLDETTAEVLNKLNYPHLRVVPLAQLEGYDKDLLAVKPDRKQIEYFFTLSPIFPRYLLNTVPVNSITYLDQTSIFMLTLPHSTQNWGKILVYIIPHRFPEKDRERENYEIYNVGLLIFKNDARGLACLRWWREKCLEWCYDRMQPERFADQKYLDHWPALFEGVKVSQHVGANLAPWNFSNYRIITLPDNKATVDGQPLIFYHFQGLRLASWWLNQPRVWIYAEPMAPSLLHWFYDPYIQILKNMYREIKQTEIATNRPFSTCQRRCRKKAFFTNPTL